MNWAVTAMLSGVAALVKTAACSGGRRCLVLVQFPGAHSAPFRSFALSMPACWRMGSPDASRKWTIFVQNYGSLTEATPDRRAETVIIIEPTKPEELLPFSMTAYGLSPREEGLVKLVVRGLSTTQISRTLFISEHTVQNHLRSVFEKVGVGSRGELVKQLFFDNLYPTLFR